MPKEELTYEKIHNIHQKERRAPSLVKLDYDFYDDFSVYIENLRAELDRENAINPVSVEAMILNDEFRNVNTMYKEICEHRVLKILKLAHLSFMGLVADTKSLARQEKALHEEIVQYLTTWKEDMLKAIEKPSQAQKSAQVASTVISIPEPIKVGLSPTEKSQEPRANADDAQAKTEHAPPPSNAFEEKKNVPAITNVNASAHTSPATAIPSPENAAKTIPNAPIATKPQPSNETMKQTQPKPTAAIAPAGGMHDDEREVDDEETARKRASVENKEDALIFGPSKSINTPSVESAHDAKRPINTDTTILLVVDDLGGFVSPDDAVSYHLRAKDVITFSNATADILKRSGKVVELKCELWA